MWRSGRTGGRTAASPRWLARKRKERRRPSACCSTGQSRRPVTTAAQHRSASASSKKTTRTKFWGKLPESQVELSWYLLLPPTAYPRDHQLQVPDALDWTCPSLVPLCSRPVSLPSPLQRACMHPSILPWPIVVD